MMKLHTFETKALFLHIPCDKRPLAYVEYRTLFGIKYLAMGRYFNGQCYALWLFGTEIFFEAYTER